MRFPKTTSLGIRTPFLPRLNWLSISRAASLVCTVAFWILAVGAAIVPAAVIGRKLLSPDAMLIAGEGENAIQLPLPWAYVLLVAVAAFAYLAASALIFRLLLRIIATLRAEDPCHPLNVRRLHQIGAAFASVTLGVWVGQFLVARFVRGAMPAPSLFDLITPAFAVVIIVVTAELFREGARLRREAELTI
jgi:hypothetical protein